MIEVATAKGQSTAAYKNVHRLRVVMRKLYRGSGLDPKHSASSGGSIKDLKTAQDLTDDYLASIPSHTKGPLRSAIANERLRAAQVGGGMSPALKLLVREAYELSQQLPSWAKMPDGKDENTLRAIEALLKTSKGSPETVMNAIKMIIDPSLVKFVPKPKPKPKPKPMVAPAAKYNLTPVNKLVAYPWGYQVPYYMIPKHAPMTWGACQVWVEKVPGEAKPGKIGDTFFIHPEFAAEKHKEYHAKHDPKVMVNIPSAGTGAVLEAFVAEPDGYDDPPPDDEEPDIDIDDEGSF